MKFAKIPDAPFIHDLMFKAFMDYKDDVLPLSALEETGGYILIMNKG